MPNLNWSELSPLQLGRYAEYYAKMEFALSKRNYNLLDPYKAEIKLKEILSK